VKNLWICCVVVVLAMASPGSNQQQDSAQLLSAIPVDVDIPVPPTPVGANGKIHLLYELHLTNFSGRDLELTRLEVLTDRANTSPLASYADAELASRLARPGAAANLPDPRIIGGGMRAISSGDFARQNIPIAPARKDSFKFPGNSYLSRSTHPPVWIEP